MLRLPIYLICATLALEAAAADFDGNGTTAKGAAIDAGVLQRIAEARTALGRDPQLEAMQRRYHEIYDAVHEGVVSIHVQTKTLEALAEEGRQKVTGNYFDGGDTGSGFIVDAPSGLIVTNAHVVSMIGRNGRHFKLENVKNAFGKNLPDKTAKTDHVVRSLVTVTLFDGTILPADVLDFDTNSDIALLAIHPIGGRPLRALPLGDSTKVRVGDFVVAVGTPFHQANTFTYGQVSTLNRISGRMEFLQTDAATNPGNSGGPLFNIDGEVIGVNSDIVSRSGASAGISLAIMIEKVMEKIRLYSQTGTMHAPSTEMVYVENAQGTVDVRNVFPDGAADRAGVRKGDRILAVDGVPLLSTESQRASDMLVDWVNSKKLGAPLVLTIERSGYEAPTQRLELTLFPE